MRAFNRVVMILILAGLLVLGGFALVYAAGLFGYEISALPISGVVAGVQGFVRGVEGGNPSSLTVAALVTVALTGIVLLVAEIKPRTPRRVRMDEGTYVARDVVKERAEEAARTVPEVLEADARTKARRRPGAKVVLTAKVRPGGEVRVLTKAVRGRVSERLGEDGLPVARIKVEVAEVDPRQAKARVK